MAAFAFRGGEGKARDVFPGTLMDPCCIACGWVGLGWVGWGGGGDGAEGACGRGLIAEAATSVFIAGSTGRDH